MELDQLQSYIADCGTTTKVMGYFLFVITGLFSGAVAALWVRLGKVQTSKDENDKQYIVTLEKMGHIIDSVMNNVSNISPEIKEEMGKMEGRIQDSIKQIDAR